MSFDPLSIDVGRLLAALGIEARHDGDSWLARCPSGRHADRDPSWRIRDEPGSARHGLHFCQSCKFGGTATQLVQDVQRYANASVAVEWIEQHAIGVGFSTLTLTIPSLGRPRCTLPPEAMILPSASWADTPKRYLVEDRGLAVEQIDRWGLGYAVAGKHAGRIFFPARTVTGELLGWTARTFTGGLVRYLSCPEGNHPDPSAVFGEQHWPRVDARQQLVVTEGGINGLAAERALPGICFGALSGSNVHLGQVLKVATFQEVAILTDSDLAGDNAAEKLLAAIGRHVRATRVKLGPRTDPASLLKRAPSELTELIRGAFTSR